ncbi:hypothetical protein GBA52_015918 [Prunus armeniaca]|nr:hypothetical protein GBA52_015918 [Prunus armeniaca]
MMRGEKERRGEEKRKKEEMMRTKNNLKFHSIAITRVAIRGNVLTSICQAIKAQDFKGVIIKQVTATRVVAEDSFAIYLGSGLLIIF